MNALVCQAQLGAAVHVPPFLDCVPDELVNCPLSGRQFKPSADDVILPWPNPSAHTMGAKGSRPKLKRETGDEETRRLPLCRVVQDVNLPALIDWR